MEMIASTFVKIINKNEKIWRQVAFTNNLNKQFPTFWITNYCLFYKNYFMETTNSNERLQHQSS